MTGEKSWAEGSWWRGAKRGHNWLLWLLLLLVLPFPLHLMMMRQKASPPSLTAAYMPELVARSRVSRSGRRGRM